MTLRMSSGMPPKRLVYFRKFFYPRKNAFSLAISHLTKPTPLLDFRKSQQPCGSGANFRRNDISVDYNHLIFRDAKHQLFEN